MRQTYLTICAVSLGLLLAACQSPDDGSSQSAAPDPKNVVARVNGEALSETALDAQMQALAARGQPANRSQALQELVTVELLAQEAEKRGLPEQPDIAAEIERQRASLLAQHLIRGELDTHEVDDEAMRSRYEEQVAARDGGIEYKARHILVESEDEAKSLIKQLDEGGDFQALAKEHSTGPSGSRGGDLGWFQAGDMVAPFSTAVEALEPGKHSQTPVETQFGWHVIQLDDTRKAEPPAFEDIKSQLRNRMVSEHIQQFVSELREQADIEITEQATDAAEGGGGGSAENEDAAAGSAASSTQ